MELVAAVLIAGPLGYFAGRRALAIYIALWAVIFPIQTIAVSADEGIDLAYFLVNAAILALGIGLNRLGAHLRERRVSAAAAS